MNLEWGLFSLAIRPEFQFAQIISDMKHQSSGISWDKVSMTDLKSKQKKANLYVASSDVDVTDAILDPSLAKVWSEEESGALAVSMDRVLFESLTDIASRYLEPNGFTQNLENILAVIDSMRIGVFASVSSKVTSDGRVQARRLMPAISMQLPRKNDIGPILQKFYAEVGRYEAELSRLQLIESKAKRSMDAGIKDESGKKQVDALRVENAALREEILKLGKKLALAQEALRSVPNSTSDQVLPHGMLLCTVRSVRVQEGTVLFKAGESQFTLQLRTLSGTPVIGAKAVAFAEGGLTRAVMFYDPQPVPFAEFLAEILAVDGRRVKLKFSNRRELVLTLGHGQDIPPAGASILGRFSGEHLVSLALVATTGGDQISDLIFEEQTKRQLEENLNREAS